MLRGQGRVLIAAAAVVAAACGQVNSSMPVVATPPIVEPSDSAVITMRFDQPPRRAPLFRASRSRVGASSAPTSPVPSKGTIKAMGYEMNAARGWGEYWGSLDRLWEAESGWNPNAVNSKSGACGIMQRYPCNGYDDYSVRIQIKIGLDYIGSRYGNPGKAYGHFLSVGWY